MQTNPFRLARKTPLGLVELATEKLTGLDRLNAYYQNKPQHLDCQAFLHYALKTLAIDYQITNGSSSNIPKQGACVIVANHPLGALEGMILANILLKTRSDVKILANQVLKRVPELNELFIAVDVFESKNAMQTNIKAMRQAKKHLEAQGIVLIFPAGEVSTYDNQQQIRDIAWRKSCARLIRQTQADALCIHIQGQNSRSFYWAGKVHPFLRTAMLGHELLNKSQQVIDISIGQTIKYQEMQSLADDQSLTDYLRLNTYLLAPSCSPPLSPSSPLQTIIEPINPDSLALEISQLPKQSHLLDFKNFSVYCCSVKHIPLSIKEIGRIREHNFRQVDEGTGKACDLDHFDRTYKHLFIWDKDRRAIVGAYRLGLTDRITQKQGLNGLYSQTLFHYEKDFLQTMGPAIEMGRSVIDKPYQKSLTALMLLWKGIAMFASRNPQYTHLFGPVSISRAYSPIARQLLVSTLTMHYFDQEKASMVKAKNPLNTNDMSLWHPDMLTSLADIQLLSKVLARINQQSVPILLKQYLNLNGRLVSFNIDHKFNDALDGLIIVDLRNVPLKTLAKYMGEENASHYLNYHTIKKNK